MQGAKAAMNERDFSASFAMGRNDCFMWKARSIAPCDGAIGLLDALPCAFSISSATLEEERQ